MGSLNIKIVPLGQENLDFLKEGLGRYLTNLEDTW